MSHRASGGKYPQNAMDLYKMNRIFRHRLRNLCAGVRMTVERIARVTAETHPDIPGRCDIIKDEMDNLQRFTDRMDLLFDTLPAPENKSLFELLSQLRTFFSRKFPFCSLELQGTEAECVIGHGSWLAIALEELITNAGEAAGNEGGVILTWTTKPLSFSIVNDGGGISGDIPIAPPQPFNTEKSRHDGIGMAIAFRICSEINSKLTIGNGQDDSVYVKIVLPKEEIIQ